MIGQTIQGKQGRTFTISREIGRGGFGVVYLALILAPMRTRQEFFERGAWIFAAYCVIAAYDFHPWYILWVMAMATLMERMRVVLWVGLCAVFVLYVPMGWKEVIVVAFGPLGVAMLLNAARCIQSSRWGPKGFGLFWRGRDRSWDGGEVGQGGAVGTLV